MESFSTLAQAIPTGVFDNGAIDDFLAKLFAAPGRTNDFRKLSRKLFLVATNLDTGASVTFGPHHHAHVPISRAIEASSALPGLFPPVRDRRRVLRRRRAQQDAARVGRARRGREAPAVRQSAGAVRRELRAASRAHQRRQAPPGRAAAGARPDVPRDHPFADEGRHGKIRAAVSGRRRPAVRARPRRCRHVLRQHLQLLAAQAPVRDGVREDAAEPRCARADVLAPILRRHGIAIRRDRLADSRRDVADGADRPAAAARRIPRSLTVQQTTRELRHTLDQLERAVAGAR